MHLVQLLCLPSDIQYCQVPQKTPSIKKLTQKAEKEVACNPCRVMHFIEFPIVGEIDCLLFFAQILDQYWTLDLSGRHYSFSEPVARLREILLCESERRF